GSPGREPWPRDQVGADGGREADAEGQYLGPSTGRNVDGALEYRQIRAHSDRSLEPGAAAHQRPARHLCDSASPTDSSAAVRKLPRGWDDGRFPPISIGYLGSQR